MVPFLPLARTLYAGAAVPDVTGAGVAVVVTADEQTVAVGVDRLAGTTTLVARPLPELAPAAAGDRQRGHRPGRQPAAGAGPARPGGRGAAATGPRPAASPRPQRRQLPILVVDDSLTTRMLERSILESAGYEVDLAALRRGGPGEGRGPPATGCSSPTSTCPASTGSSSSGVTRADPDLAAVPAILVSSRATAQDRQRGTEAGAAAYVVKGEFNQEELLAHIRRLIL